MKIKFARILAGACLMAALITAPMLPAMAQTVKWKLGSSVGPQDPTTLDLLRYAAAVKERSKGKLELEIVPIETVGFKNVDSLRVLKQGVMQAMHLVPYYLFRDAPILAALAPHGVLLEPEDNLKIEQTQREFANKIYQQWGIEPAVPWHAGGLRDIVLVSKEPLTSLAELKGKKLRHFTKDGVQAFNELGIATQIVPSSELYLALKTGVVDAAVYGWTYIKSQSIYETTCCASYLAPFTSAFPFVIGVRQQDWKSLDPALKAVMVDVGKQFHAEALQAWRDSKADNEAKAWLADKGMKILDPFPIADRKAIQTALLKVWREQCEKIGPEAVENYKRVVAALGL